MNQKRNLKPLVVLASVCASVATVFYFISKFIVKNFGEVTIPQILLNVRTAETSNSLLLDYIKIAVPYVIKCAIVLFIIFYIAKLVNRFDTFGAFFIFLLKKIKETTASAINFINNKPQTLVLVLLLVVTLYLLKAVDRKLHVFDYLKQEDSSFVEQNYARLDIGSAIFENNKKQNLILLFAESIEKGYSDESVYGDNLIKELVELKKEGVSLYGYRKTPGGYFTLDGISAQTLGMPLTQLPIDINNSKFNDQFGALLSKTPGIFNLLKESGYKTASFSGTSKTFTNKGMFLNVHGIDNPYFKEHWLESGFLLDDKTRGFWDFSDVFLMERFKEYLSKTEQDKPFAVLFETVDTHFPNGWAPVEYRKDGGFKDAVRFSSKLIYDFVQWAKTQPWYNDTMIVIVGDHPFQDFNVDFTQFTKKSNNREIYTLFINSKIKKDIVMGCGYSPMDIAPTILHAMGVSFKSAYKDRLDGNRIGLGTSLLSQEKNLVCQYGVNDLYQKLWQFSSFYQNLH